MEKHRLIVDSIVRALGIEETVRRVFIEGTDSPWSEKILVKRKKDGVDAKITVWTDNVFLYGRFYRLLMYLYDMLDLTFAYNSLKVPDETRNPSVRELYVQIWSIYVDSRVARQGVPNFYTRTMRRNLFIDARKDLSWEEASTVFDRLWETELYTHSDIIEYAHALDSRLASMHRNDTSEGAFEIRMGEFLRGHSVSKHIERVSSAILKEILHDILNFTAYTCKGTIIRSSYYGICFDYEKRTFAELIPDREEAFLTFLARHVEDYRTIRIKEACEPSVWQNAMKDTFRRLYEDAGGL